MIFEMTYQIRVSDFEKGKHWYETLLKKKPDFVPHEDFAEWEIIPCCWLQVTKGDPAENSGPIRLGIKNIESERQRLMKELQTDYFEIHEREEVPVKWATFKDPWGNQLGFFQYLDEKERDFRIAELIGNK
ncbi:VOC family protein [Bacillus sp. SG-1]|uniref:VOC family protein n=1 Tax=Bacillus sp. SG-1 TaxID=161544 RepID=UPI0001543131|nr:VOC family protein [Bacillus sp. SG-1]EDL65499.1 glyoxalase family protein [Bacillus sp. SG-1]